MPVQLYVAIAAVVFGASVIGKLPADMIGGFASIMVLGFLLGEIGGLAAMERVNTAKAALLYRALDDSDGFYAGHAAPADRSKMNVAFKLPTPELEATFIAAARAAGFSGLGGHRSIGGIRASIYNGLTFGAVEKLVDFMDGFRRQAPRP